MQTGTGALAGLKREGATEGKGKLSPLIVDPRPMAGLLLGVALGTAGGVWVRTHAWLAPQHASPTQAYVDELVSAGVEPAEALSLAIRWREASLGETLDPHPEAGVAYLFANSASDDQLCRELRLLIAAGRSVREVLLNSADTRLEALANACPDDDQLATIVEDVLCR